MNTDALKLFLEVAHKLNFAAVAAEHGVNPSSVSRTIGQIEESLGVRLFQRTTRTMSLTEAGEAFYQRVRWIIEELEEAEEQARGLGAGPTGTLRLTASVAFGERVIVPLLAELRSLYPDIKFDLLFTDTNLDLVSEGIDLAVRLGPMITGDLVCTRLFSTHYRVVASPDYLKASSLINSPSDLSKHKCTSFALPSFRSEWHFRTRSKPGSDIESVPIEAGTLVTSALSLRSIVLGGGGPALLADWLVANDIKSGKLVELLPDYEATATDFDTAAWLVYPSRNYLPQKVRVTIDYLKAKLAN